MWNNRWESKFQSELKRAHTQCCVWHHRLWHVWISWASVPVQMLLSVLHAVSLAPFSSVFNLRVYPVTTSARLKINDNQSEHFLLQVCHHSNKDTWHSGHTWDLSSACPAVRSPRLIHHSSQLRLCNYLSSVNDQTCLWFFVTFRPSKPFKLNRSHESLHQRWEVGQIFLSLENIFVIPARACSKHVPDSTVMSLSARRLILECDRCWTKRVRRWNARWEQRGDGIETSRLIHRDTERQIYPRDSEDEERQTLQKSDCEWIPADNIYYQHHQEMGFGKEP